MPQVSDAARQLKEIRTRTGLSIRAVADLLGMESASKYQHYEDRFKKPHLPVDLVMKLATIFKPHGVKPAELYRLAGMNGGTALADDEHELDAAPEATPAAQPAKPLKRAGALPEIDVCGGMGGGGESLLEYHPDGNGSWQVHDGIAAIWDFPPEYLRHELHLKDGAGRLIPVRGDSMEPTLHANDRVIVDLANRQPSPGGIFALWDGIGVVVKRLEHIPNSDPPRLVISSDNPKHKTYERTLEEVNIIGRVVWFARRL